jgi:hypothetical protein
MQGTQLFTTRSEKEIFLKEIIKKLSISDIEKDIYIMSIEILEDFDFEEFYKKITSQIGARSPGSIAPLTSSLM